MSEAAITPPKRYHPALVSLHWVIAILIFLNVFMASAGGEERRGGASLAGIPLISIHMVLGILILVLLIARLVTRFATRRPAWADTGNALLNKVGEVTHWLLYLLTFAATITGIFLATQTNRLAQIFGLPGTQPGNQFLPRDQFPPEGQFGGEGFRGGGGFRFGLGGLHGMIWTLLLLLILLHVGAALYHQFFIKDNLLKRMWFGKQAE